MSTTCSYSDIVLPTAKLVRKERPHTSDMHPFIHPLSAAVDRCGKAAAIGTSTRFWRKRFRRLRLKCLAKKKDVVLVPLQHDTPGELGQAFHVKIGGRGETVPLPGKTMASVAVVERDYPNVYASSPRLVLCCLHLANGRKGISWKTGSRDRATRKAERVVKKGLPKVCRRSKPISTLRKLSCRWRPRPTAKSRCALGLCLAKRRGAITPILAAAKEDEKIRFRDIQAQRARFISSPTWSGIESRKSLLQRRLHQCAQLIPCAR